MIVSHLLLQNKIDRSVQCTQEKKDQNVQCCAEVKDTGVQSVFGTEDKEVQTLIEEAPSEVENSDENSSVEGSLSHIDIYQPANSCPSSWNITIGMNIKQIYI